MSLHWHRAMALALVGERLDLAPTEAPDVGDLLAQLAANGWERTRIAELAHAAPQRPFPVAPADRAGLGPAQFTAALGEARAALDLVALDVRPRSARRVLDADERRLLADVPPHW